MFNQENTCIEIHTAFGIDEIYISSGLKNDLLKKLQYRAEITFDSSDPITLKYANHDMVLVFQQSPNRHLIHRFLKRLHDFSQKNIYIESHTLLNEDELYEAVKNQRFVLITTKNISDN